MAVAPGKRLTAEDWTDAALRALADGGLAALAVEPIAAGLGATKGSFYWHFANRDALLEAALAHWERTETDEVIAQVEAVPTPAARLRALFGGAVGHEYAASRGARVELALQPTASHPLVAPVLERVTRRRIEYLSAQFTDLGFESEEARRRGLLAYTAYLGHAQLAHATPSARPADLPAYVDTVIGALVS
jgi:AcrR family transcriptional regulator